MVVFINKVDVADPELLELVELETRDILGKHGYGQPAVVRGSALRALQAVSGETLEASAVEAATACIRELLAVMDVHIPEPRRDLDGPFMLPIEDVCAISGRGTVVTGRATRGRLRPGDDVELAGGAQRPNAVIVTSIQEFHENVPEALAGHNVGLLLRGVDRDEVVRGQVLIAPGSLRAHGAGRAEIFLLTRQEGGRHTAFGSGYSPQLFFGVTDVTATLRCDDGQVISPGDHVTIDFELHKPIAIEPGMRFAMRESGKTIGAGVVVEVR